MALQLKNRAQAEKKDTAVNLQDNIFNVERIFTKKGFDVNAIIGGKYYIAIEKLLSVALQNIKFENDDWFIIGKKLLQCQNIDLNAECGDYGPKTILGILCNTLCESTIGVDLMLKDFRTDVNRR